MELMVEMDIGSGEGGVVGPCPVRFLLFRLVSA